ncbi:MAG TPA: hypothetical protein VJZ02_04720 [Candidatus Brocadiales bacterium]|nr:hypothetical protein [Candidatus Brocadiales bacterium]
MLVAEHCEPHWVHSQSQQALNRPFAPLKGRSGSRARAIALSAAPEAGLTT